MKKQNVLLFGAIGLMGLMFYIRNQRDIENYDAANSWIKQGDAYLDAQEQIKELQQAISALQNGGYNAQRRVQAIINLLKSRATTLKNKQTKTAKENSEYNSLVIALQSVGVTV